jgi:Ca2+-binding RTX toxin-like protein
MGGGLGNDVMNGNGGNDSLLGNDGNDTIDGALGNDNIQGNTGNDNLLGGRGSDTVNGGSGNDIVRGASGMDNLIGGGDADIFDFKRTDGHDTIADYNDAEDIIRVDVVNTGAPGMVKVQDGADVKVTFAGVTGFSITIADETASNINLGDFIFV